MKELITRAISGILYVALLTITMFSSPLSFYCLIIVFAGLALWEFQRLIKFESLVVPFALAALFLATYLSLLPTVFFDVILFASLAVNAIISFFCLTNRQVDFSKGSKTALILFYITGSSIFIPKLLGLNAPGEPYYLLFFYLAIWVNNSFAYLVGSRIGKTKLLPAISPKKSWEGYAGGAVATIILLYFVENNFSLYGDYWWGVALIIPALATLGDFVQSYFKRRANVKDSGTLLPGHGGFYDRMDSVIFTAPFYFLLLKLI